MTRGKQPRLAFGSAQLGLPYGIANTQGMPPEADAIALVRDALNAGIDTFDTARAYGDAERRIGLACPADTRATIVTKLDPLAQITPDMPVGTAVAAARASLAASRTALKRRRIDVLLLHRAQHRKAWGGAIWDALRAERDAGGIGRLGVSAQSPEEARAAIGDPDVAHLQLPFNLLDRRWSDGGIVEMLRARPDLAVHVRSVFLQGLLAGAPAPRWPQIAGLDPSALLATLNQLAGEMRRESLADLALAFVRAQDWIDGIVIGIETREQLMTNVALFTRPPLSESEILRLRSAIPPVDAQLLDPARWPKGAEALERAK
jgi:spore coat polysaccharide biosynthesis protein SpsF